MKELALHVLDLAQNSIAAGASQLEIEIDENTALNLLKISVVDNGHGIDPEFLDQVLKPFVTTKKTEHAGQGLPLLHSLVRQCGGNLSLESMPGLGTAVRAAFRLDNADLPPVGDMPATIVAALLARDDVNLVYRHVVDGRVFKLNTEEIKVGLDPAALSDPKVLILLHSLIEKGLAELYGGERIGEA